MIIAETRFIQTFISEYQDDFVFFTLMYLLFTNVVTYLFALPLITKLSPENFVIRGIEGKINTNR